MKIVIQFRPVWQENEQNVLHQIQGIYPGALFVVYRVGALVIFAILSWF